MQGSMNLEAIVEAAIARLDETNQARETALATSRSLIRQCANAIRATHRHEWDAAEVMLGEADRIAAEPAAYLNGLAEAASELRRYILDGLRKGDVTTGEQLLGTMDDVYSQLVTVDYPDGVTGG